MARILVIEDDPGMRVLLEEALAGAGHEVLAAVNGKEGVLLFRAHPANLVITDLFMPEQEGLETIRQLRSVNPALKIIAISGAAPEWRVLEMAKHLGAQKTLAKPFVLQEIRDAVETLLKP